MSFWEESRVGSFIFWRFGLPKRIQNNVSLWTMAEETIGHRGMYNGNISWMETNLSKFGKQAMLYKYDQLNRITKSRSLAFGNNAYAARSGDQKYDEDYSYDANGNILTLNRKDDKAAVMDDFNYSYYANTNRLLKHKTAGGTYEYDAIGNLVKDNNENLSIAWTPSGKVRSVVKPDTTIYFRYDAMGNRIAKIVSTASKNDTTAYVRDASGNVMTVYNNRTAGEAPIYGSSRIGEYTGKEKEGYQTFNLRKYELTNHLGNVLAVISDKVNLYGHNNILDSARATVASASDYYPFGLPMKGRTLDSAGYRFGFNGKENDKEFGWQDYGMRMYMRRLGRFPSPDPITAKYPELSTYQFASNSPISGIDLDGLEFSLSTNGNSTKFSIKLVIINSSKVITNAKEVNNIVTGMKNSVELTYSKSYGETNYSTEVSTSMYEGGAIISGLNVMLYDAKANEKSGTVKTGHSLLGETQNNLIRVAVSIDGVSRSQEEINRTLNHELGHAGGNYHPWDKENDVEDIQQGSPNVSKETVKKNLLNSEENPKPNYGASKGKDLTEGQLRKIKTTVEKQQPSQETNKSQTDK